MNTDAVVKSKAGQGKVLKRKLEELRQLALDRGADDAVVIPTSEVIVDPRVRLKCMIPQCYSAGRSSYCPPYGYTTQEVRDIVSRYEWAIFFRVSVKNSIIAAISMTDCVKYGVMDNGGNAINLGGHYFLVFTIVKLLQKRAKALGYASTQGFGAGTCRSLFCSFQLGCQDLLTRRGCLHPNLACPSMESCGMNAYTMAARVGWDIYPIGGTCQPDSVPHGNLMGLVLVT